MENEMSWHNKRTLQITAETTVADIRTALMDLPSGARFDVHETPHLNHPVDPGGDKTIIVSWEE